MKNLIQTSLRQQAMYIPASERKQSSSGSDSNRLNDQTARLSANLARLGYGLNEPLLKALNETSTEFQDQVLQLLRKVMGVQKNWTPLVKGWDTPTGESWVDHLLTLYANVFGAKGVTLQCGHLIPDGTFPLERYNGCPFCGTPFEFERYRLDEMGQGSKLKVLNLWTDAELDGYFKDLLESKTALDATQMDSLKILLDERPFPESTVGMKETLMAVIDLKVGMGREDEAGKLFKNPTDVLRYLWFKHTGFLQLVEPRVIARRKSKNRGHIVPGLDKGAEGSTKAKKELKLKYGRPECMRVARWLNALQTPPEAMAEIMHPKREIWVRFIRALRLVEISKRSGFENLRQLLEVFHSGKYTVWQGRVHHFRLKEDEEQTMALLKQRPGLFARSLFANMLYWGAAGPLKAFSEISDKVPARLVFTLSMYAPDYFSSQGFRVIKPLGGNNKAIPKNPLLSKYKGEELDAMVAGIEDLCVSVMRKRFAVLPNENKTIYIEPSLYKMPVAIGDRSDSIQDLPVALMGTRFALEGNAIRLFLQWGEGLPAQHLDMDLSCHVAYESESAVCSYFNLNPVGCKHSGDIRRIPDQIGTAEYIEIDVDTLGKAGAKFVTFTCNAYSNGELSPNLVVGWMDSKNRMKISEKTGVAYDPSCVQHQVKITQGLVKGLVFGVLEVEKREIVWLEMAFGGQTIGSLDTRGVRAMLAKLDSKLNVGSLLKLKAEAQGLHILSSEEEADESYTTDWARNAAAVTRLLVD